MPDAGDGARLFREIREHPDEDGPRVVYADWLLAHASDPAELAHAELIQLQCGLARAHAAEIPALQARVNELLGKYRRTWVAPLTQANIRGTWQFRRGFLDAGRLTARRFAEVAPILFEHAPMLRALTFPEAANELAGLAASPYLARLDEVVLHEMCRCGSCKVSLELPSLFASPHTHALRRLVLSACRIEAPSARLLFGSTHLARLRVLDLHTNQIDGSGLATLVDRPRTFTRLVLSGNPLGDAGARALGDASQLAIEELELADCEITKEGAAALAGAAWGDGLRKLVLVGNPIGKGEARAALRERYGDRVEL